MDLVTLDCYRANLNLFAEVNPKQDDEKIYYQHSGIIIRIECILQVIGSSSMLPIPNCHKHEVIELRHVKNQISDLLVFVVQTRYEMTSF